MKKSFDNTAFRQVMGSFTTGVAVVTARDPDLGVIGLTINSLTSVSLDPALVLFCLDKSTTLYKAFRKAPYYAINFLSHGQEDISRHFASRHSQAKPKNMWAKSQQETPILRASLGWVLCEPEAYYKGGDHTIFVGNVVNLHKRAGHQEPLVYFHGRYRDLAEGNVTSGARK